MDGEPDGQQTGSGGPAPRPPLDATVLGMRLQGDADIALPLGALVVVKGLDAEGNVAYWATTTDDVTSVECLGMAAFATEVLRLGVGNTDDDGPT